MKYLEDDVLPATLRSRGWSLSGPLGSGGMAQVYAVSDPGLGRTLALKVARGEPDGFAWKRLQREAHLTAALSGDGVVAVHEVGTLADGRP